MKIQKENWEALTEKNMKMIHNRAHSFRRTTGIEYDELFSIASIGFVKALKNYDSKFGTEFTTLAYKYMNNELLEFAKKQKRYRATFIPLEDLVQRCPSDSSGLPISDF